jgi:hypothetical protein
MLSKNPVKCFQRGVVEIAGSFTVDGSGDVLVTTGQGFTPVHTTTGVYTLTLDEIYQDFVSGHASVQFATGTTTNFDLLPQLGLYTGAAGILVLRIWDCSAAALGDPSNGDAVHFSLKLKWTSV